MDAAWARGVRRFDTASSYGGGRSERTIGAWLRERKPDGLALTSKAFHPVHEGDDSRARAGAHPSRRSREPRAARRRANRPLSDPRARSGDAARETRSRRSRSSSATDRSERSASPTSTPRPRGGARACADRGRAERVLAARARRRARRAAALRRARGRVPGVQPAGGRLADGQVLARDASSPPARE